MLEDLNVRVPKEYEEDFKYNGILALTQYLCDPPLTEGGFFENPHMLYEAVNKKRERIMLRHGQRQELLDDGQLRRYVRFDIEQMPTKLEGAQYFAHGDPGLVKDAFAFGVAHPSEETKTITVEGGHKLKLPKVVVDFVIAWEPRPNRPVDLLNQEEIMMEIVKYYNIRRVTFDRWNSAGSIQKLVAQGVDADASAFTNVQQYNMYRFFRLMLYNNMLDLPDDPDMLNELVNSSGNDLAQTAGPGLTQSLLLMKAEVRAAEYHDTL